MKHYYESEILNQLMERDGLNNPSSTPVYESEIREQLLNQVTPSYPKLNDYEPEWLMYNHTKHLPANFPVESVTNVTQATFNNAVPYAYGKAVLKGRTLVNIHPKNYKIEMQSGTIFSTNAPIDISLIKPNTKYFIRIYNAPSNIRRIYFKPCDTSSVAFTDINNKYTIHTTKSDLTEYTDAGRIHIYTSAGTTATQADVENVKIIICEYQEGMENWDIPYFEGMQSVQMPVLTTSNGDGTKTNILTVNEDVELRGIGDVKDELNCLTGELTQRIGEVVLDGSQTYTIPTGEEFNTIQRFITTIPNIKNVNVICDKLPTKTTSLSDDERLFVASIGENGSVYFNLLKTKATNIDELKTYLSQNPITIQYQLKIVSVKTVDLTCVNQDGESSLFMPFEGTNHLETLGQAIKPQMDVEVPVEAINQNLASFIVMDGEGNE